MRLINDKIDRSLTGALNSANICLKNDLRERNSVNPQFKTKKTEKQSRLCTKKKKNNILGDIHGSFLLLIFEHTK